jgi:hypothetical protein
MALICSGPVASFPSTATEIVPPRFYVSVEPFAYRAGVVTVLEQRGGRVFCKTAAGFSFNEKVLSEHFVSASREE